jgi:hypothetical protein
MSESDFFDRFDAEVAEESQRRSVSTKVSVEDPSQDLAVLSVMKAGGADPIDWQTELPLERDVEAMPDSQTLEDQIARIKRETAEVQRLLESKTSELNREMLKRMHWDKEKQLREEELQKIQRQHKLANDMVNRQNKEMKELHASIKDLTSMHAGASGTHSGTHSTSSSRSAKVSAPQGKPKAGRPRPAVWRPVSNTLDATANNAAAESEKKLPSREVGETLGVPEQPQLLWELEMRVPSRKQYTAVLASKSKDVDAWKVYIP